MLKRILKPRRRRNVKKSLADAPGRDDWLEGTDDGAEPTLTDNTSISESSRRSTASQKDRGQAHQRRSTPQRENDVEERLPRKGRRQVKLGAMSKPSRACGGGVTSRSAQPKGNNRHPAHPRTEPTRPTKRTTSHANTLRYLNLIRQPGEVVEVFVKELNESGLTLPVNKNGFYDTDHFDVASSHARQCSGKATAIFISLNPVEPALLARRRNRLGHCPKGSSTSAEDVVARRWLLIDLDAVRPAYISSTDEEKARVKETMERIVAYLREKGWPLPIIVDSGNGYHLLCRVDLPVDDGGLVEQVLKALHHRFSDEHVKLDTGVYIPNQMVKLPGTMARKGDDLAERPHRLSRLLRIPKNGPRLVPRELLEQIAAEIPVEETANVQPVSSTPPGVIEQARSYVAKTELTTSSRSADDTIFKVACRLILGFDLGVEEAFPLLSDYCEKRSLRASEEELRRKLHEADKQDGTRGYLRRTGKAPNDRYFGLEPLEGAEFYGFVPDFADGPAWEVLKPITEYAKVYEDDFAIWYLLWRMRRSDFLVPDLFLQQCVVGRPSRNWRPALKRRLELEGTIEEGGESVVCTREKCILSGAGVRHQHFDMAFDRHGLLENFAEKDIEHGYSRFLLYDKAYKEVREKLRSNGHLVKAYWPALLFGRSRRVGWSIGQQRLLAGIIHELTYARGGQSKKRMQAHVIKDGLVIAAGKGSHTVRCPPLSSDREYVVFGGNGTIVRGWGRGYEIVGRTFRGWLNRAGYGKEPPDNRRDLFLTITRFLRDLAGLASDLGLIVAAFHPGRRKWRDLHQLQDCLKTGSGQDWLEECTVRIFTEADWLVRWRYFFARKMGFRWIPSSPDDPGPVHDQVVDPDPNRIQSAAQVSEFLAKVNMNQQGLADALGCSRKRVSRHLNGQSRTPEFFDEVEKLRCAMGHPKSPKDT